MNAEQTVLELGYAIWTSFLNTLTNMGTIMIIIVFAMVFIDLFSGKPEERFGTKSWFNHWGGVLLGFIYGVIITSAMTTLFIGLFLYFSDGYLPVTEFHFYLLEQIID